MSVDVWRQKNDIAFLIKDFGIGVFNSIMTKRHLPDEMTTIQELVKGKITTAPTYHSGEGIFWTSKIADRFKLTSFGYTYLVDNVITDYTVHKNDDWVFGTEVEFSIDIGTDKSLSGLFRQFSLNRETYSFDTTMIPVKLAKTSFLRAFQSIKI